MAKSISRPNRKDHTLWRTLVVVLLTAIGLLSFIGFSLAHWTERQILNTGNWVQLVGPLPQNNEVADAISKYSVDKLVKETDLENKISEALPDRASFLAPTLTEQLQTRATKRTKQLIQSEQFSSVWRTANRTAHQRLIDSARGNVKQAPKREAKFGLSLPTLGASVRSILEQRGVIEDKPSEESPKEKVGFVVNLKTSLERVKSYIRAIDFLNGTLWLLSLAGFLGALLFAKSRRRQLMVISTALVVTALLMLIGVKVVRPMILNELQEISYRPAAGAIYDTLLASFRNGATNIVIFGLVLGILSFFAQKKFLAGNKRTAKWLRDFQKSKFYLGTQSLRDTVRKYRLHIMGTFTVIALFVMAFLIDVDWQDVIRAVLIVIISFEIVNLAASRPGRVPMKQKQ